MNDQDIQRIIGQMTNFYGDHLPLDSSFIRLLGIYGKLFTVAYGEADAVRNNSLIDTTETMHTLPYFKLDVTMALYDMALARQLQFLSFEMQIATLDKKNLFIPLSFLRKGSRIPLVCALTLRSTFASTIDLELNLDFFVRGNKIYLLPNFILNGNNLSGVLHAFDIKLDDKRLESNWGVLYNVELGALLPRFEYREVLHGYDQAFSGPITISNIRQAIKTVTNWGQFDLEDVKSPTLPASKKRLYDNWILSPLQFIVSIPEEIISDRVRISLLANLLEQLKEPQTNFVMFYEFERLDDFDDADDSSFAAHEINATEQEEGEDHHVLNLPMLAEDFMFSQEADIYFDSNLRYDFNSAYDLEPKSEFDGSGNFDTTGFDAVQVPSTDDFFVYVRTFPEIPRLSAASVAGNMVTVTCRPNNDGTLQFGLYGATAVDGPYTFLSFTDNDPLAAQIVMNHDANITGNTYYKIMAVAGDYDSLFTLPLQIVLV